jgi:type II secretory pathway pseudopilin PulG
MSIVIAVCAVAGAIAGIAGSAASPSSSSSKAKATQAQKKAQARADRLKRKALRRAFRVGPGPRFGPGFGFGFGPVHAEAVIPKEDGSGFFTVTTDGGTLLSVDGTTVHLKEGTDKATYKADVGIDVGSDAKVIRNHQDAKLSDLKAGDHVRVITGGPKGNIVIAEDDAFLAQQKKRFERGFHHRFFGPGGPPPGEPGEPGEPTRPGAYPGDEAPGGTNS